MPLIPVFRSPHLRILAESEPLADCQWFWVNGHRVPRVELTVCWHEMPADVVDDPTGDIIRQLQVEWNAEIERQDNELAILFGKRGAP